MGEFGAATWKLQVAPRPLGDVFDLRLDCCRRSRSGDHDVRDHQLVYELPPKFFDNYYDFAMTVLTADQWEAQMATVLAAFEDDFDLLSIEIEPIGVTLEAAVVTSLRQKATGMIGRTFDQFDAMLFVENRDNMVAMHNKGVAMPLLVAFFDATGALVDQFRLDADDATPRRPGRAFRYALELPGTSDELPDDAKLKVAL